MFSSLLNQLGKLLPTCYTALDIAEQGIKRPLKLHDKIRLKYNSRLCLYCNCAQDRFDCAMEKLKKADDDRER